MTKYTLRVTKEKGKVTLWIDKDNEICIRQPMRPGTSEKDGWSSEEEAIAWGTAHLQQLTEAAANNEIVEINKQVSEELARQANRATILQSAALAVLASKQNDDFSELFIKEAQNSLNVLTDLGQKHQSAIQSVKSNYKEITAWHQILALE